MTYNPITRELLTNDNKLIKKLFCPYKINWGVLEYADGKSKICLTCSNSILDTSHFTDNELYTLLMEKPDTCLKIDFNQKNITISTHGYIE